MIWTKICGTTNLEDALLCAQAGADALGFVFAESPRRVSPEQAEAIAHQLPPTVERVGVFANATAEQIELIVQRVGLTCIQLHGGEDAALVQQVTAVCPGISVIKAFSGSDPANLTQHVSPQLRGWLSAVLIDSGSVEVKGGTGQVFPWEAARPVVSMFQKTIPVIIAGGLDSGNVSEALRLLTPWGVDVATGVEQQPGKKDPEKVRAFMQAVRSAGRVN